MGRRRQRPIPVIAPKRNTTLEFAERVGMLYYGYGDHNKIAAKMVTFFLDTLRSRYHVRTNELGSETYKMIARRSGVPLELVLQTFNTIAHMSMTTRMSEDDLLALNSSLEKFNKARKQ
jgi:hypothetical protein